MTAPLIPERFGCGSKLDFEELVDLRRAAVGGFGRDATPIPNSSPPSLNSIDKVFQVGVSAHDFCRLALKHAAADLVSSGARLRSVMTSFEFGPELGPAERRALSFGMYDAAKESGAILGKCHSSEASSTALTLSVEGPVVSQFVKPTMRGAVLLSGALGGLERLFRAALTKSDASREISDLLIDNHGLMPEVVGNLAFCTDVSGYGLGGAWWEMALGLEATVSIDATSLHSIFDLSDPTPPCLTAALGRYGLPEASDTVRSGVARREFCGPFLMACADSAVGTLSELFGRQGLPKPVCLGRFQLGNAMVEVTEC